MDTETEIENLISHAFKICNYQGECLILKIPREKIPFQAKIDDCKKYKEYRKLMEKIYQQHGWWIVYPEYGRTLPNHNDPTMSLFWIERFNDDKCSFVCKISLNDLSCRYAISIPTRYSSRLRRLLGISKR